MLCFVVFCNDCVFVDVYPSPSGLFYLHWHNHIIAPVSVKPPKECAYHLRVMRSSGRTSIPFLLITLKVISRPSFRVNDSHASYKNWYNRNKQHTTQPSASFMGYILSFYGIYSIFHGMYSIFHGIYSTCPMLLPLRIIKQMMLPFSSTQPCLL